MSHLAALAMTDLTLPADAAPRESRLSRLLPRFWSYGSHSLTLEVVKPDGLRDLLRHWQDRRQGGLPALEDLPLADMAPLLPYCAVVDLRHGAGHAAYRWVGPALVKLYGRDPTGSPLRDCFDGVVLEEVLGAYQRVVRRREPLFSIRGFRILGHGFGYHRLILPLARKGDRGRDRAVFQALLGLYPGDARLTEAHQWRVPMEEMLQLERLEGG